MTETLDSQSQSQQRTTPPAWRARTLAGASQPYVFLSTTTSASSSSSSSSLQEPEGPPPKRSSMADHAAPPPVPPSWSRHHRMAVETRHEKPPDETTQATEAGPSSFSGSSMSQRQVLPSRQTSPCRLQEVTPDHPPNNTGYFLRSLSRFDPAKVRGDEQRLGAAAPGERKQSKSMASFPSVKPPEVMSSSFRSRLQSLQRRRSDHRQMPVDENIPAAPPSPHQQEPPPPPMRPPPQEPMAREGQSPVMDRYFKASESLRTTSTVTTTTNTTTKPEDAAAWPTRTKLVDLQAKIASFEAQIQAESQQRRAAEERRLNTLGESMCTLEKTLNAEIRRRLEANKTIQMGFESQLATLESHIERSLEEKERHIAAAVDALTNRIRGAENEVNAVHQAHADTVQKLKLEMERLSDALIATKENLDTELKARRQREAAMFDKMSEIEKQIEARLGLEKGIRQKDVDQLRASLESINNNHVALDDAFQKDLAAGFHELKSALEAETQARERSDDDIVQALNHYTIALQTALKIANAG